MSDDPKFANMYADEFQCPYCENPFKFQRIRKASFDESTFRAARKKLVEEHVERYHPEKRE
jgi:hypothetical protein